MKGVRLDRYLALQVRQDVSDGAGGHVETWAVAGYHWAWVQARQSFRKAGEFGSSHRLGLKIVLRAAPQGHGARPTPGSRFVDGARIYTVLAVHEDALGAGYLTCFAHEDVAP